VEEAVAVIDVSIIVLTWQPNEDLSRCLGAFLTSTMDQPREVILVDNASHNPSIDLLADQFPIIVIRNRRNRGVARARNQAMSVARGSYFFILDADTETPAGVLPELLALMDRNPRLGVISPALATEDGKVLHSCRRFPTVLTKLARRIPVPAARKQLEGEVYDLARRGEPCLVDYLIGACQLIRKEATRETGFLDEGIFYGPEDVDFCLRMWRTGWGVLYYPRLKVIHLEQRFTFHHPLSLLSLIHLRSLAYYFRKHGYLFRAPRFELQNTMAATLDL
jgi:GT2 family glycosyltransferase